MAMRTIRMLVEPNKKKVIPFVVAQTIGCTYATSSLMRLSEELLNMNVQNTLSMY
jgi:hypothetical protein